MKTSSYTNGNATTANSFASSNSTNSVGVSGGN